MPDDHGGSYRIAPAWLWVTALVSLALGACAQPVVTRAFPAWATAFSYWGNLEGEPIVELTTDAWGRQLLDQHERVYSVGPDGVDEAGQGDDVVIAEWRKGTPNLEDRFPSYALRYQLFADSGLGAFVFAAVLLVGSWISRRTARGESQVAEVARVLSISVGMTIPLVLAMNGVVAAVSKAYEFPMLVPSQLGVSLALLAFFTMILVLLRTQAEAGPWDDRTAPSG